MQRNSYFTVLKGKLLKNKWGRKTESNSNPAAEPLKIEALGKSKQRKICHW